MGKRRGTPYVDYYLSFHLGFCHGPVDALMEVRMKDKNLLDETYGDAPATITVQKNDLFGGNLREGGAVGVIDYLPGRLEQVAPDTLAQRCGLPVEQMPGYRELATLWFHGGGVSGMPGFKVGSNQPTVNAVEARFRRYPRTPIGNGGVIPSPDEKYHDVNPAHIIYEALTNPSWGMGGLASQIEQSTFASAAATLFAEDFGLTMFWTAQAEIESFIEEVLTHINGMYFFNPYTGKGHLKLLRQDYDINNIPSVGPNIAELVTFRRPQWGETVNEIILTWTNPESEEEETITYQDLGNIAMQGEVVSENRNCYGIRNATLAGKVCLRELEQASSPLATATIKVDRTLHRWLPGDVFKFEWPQLDIQQLIFRIIDIDWGKPEDAKITLKVAEDVFGAEFAVYDLPPGSEWEDPGKDPNDPGYIDWEWVFRAMPFSLINAGAAGTDFELTDDLYNEIVIGMYLLPNEDQYDLKSFIPYAPQIDAIGEASFISLGERQAVGHTKLVSAIGQAVRSTITIEPTTFWPAPQRGSIGFFFSEGGSRKEEFDEEWFQFEDFLGNGQWVIRRAILDTVPREWPSGTRIVIMTEDFDAYDASGRHADTNEEYQFQYRTSLGISDMSTSRFTNRPDRPYRPYRPANCKIESVMFGFEDQTQDTPGTPGAWLDDDHVPRSWDISVSWSRRNRFLEDNVYLAWDDPDVPPEDGQTTELHFIEPDGTIYHKIEGLTGTSTTFNIIETTSRMRGTKIRFVSKRDDFECLQAHEIELKLYIKGYGSDWDWLWGGWPEGGTMDYIEFEDMNPPMPISGGEVDTNG